MRVSAPEDSGNIEVRDDSRPDDVRLEIRDDNAARFRQWFHFRCTGVGGTPVCLRITNAGTCTFPHGWEGYAAVASYDGVDWFRVPTRYEGGELRIAHTPERDVVDYATFAPYTHARRVARLGWLVGTGSAAFRRVETLGETPDGHPIQVLELGAGPAPIWIVARQHPGETMAEWFTEGLVDRLVSGADDPVLARVLAQTTIRVVPCMNPDGARRGNHRTNARGIDLNRTWCEPDRENAPEVARVRDRMDETGVRFALDVHGDEELPWNFASGGDGTPSWNERRAELKRRFLDAWIAVNPDFQRRRGYPPAGPGEANLTICAQQLNERFGCLALTLEQPFKDNADHPDPVTGWSPLRAKKLGASLVDALDAILPEPG